MKRITVFATLVIMGILFQAAPLLAWGEVKEATKYLDMGFNSKAYTILHEYIYGNSEEGSKGHPTDLDANLQLGRYYLLVGNDEVAAERFNAILDKDKDYSTDIGTLFQEAAISEAQSEHPNCPRIYRLLSHAYSYSPSLAIDDHQTSERLIRYGDQARFQERYGCAENFYSLAQYYGNDNTRKKVAHRRLHLAYLGYKTEEMKLSAEPIVGKDFIDQVFPGPKTIIVFQNTYTDADADESGYIYAIKWDDKYQVGDQVIIEGHVPGKENFAEKEIYYYRGKNFDPKWAPTVNGKLSIRIDKIPHGKSFVISMAEGQNIHATVKVIRVERQKPKPELLAGE